MSAKIQSRIKVVESFRQYSPKINSRSVKMQFPNVLTPSVGRNRPSFCLSYRTHSQEGNRTLPKRKEEIKDTLSRKQSKIDLNLEMIKDIPRPSQSVVESWMDDILKERQVTVFPNNSNFNKAKSPLFNFGIDREKLLVI